MKTTLLRRGATSDGYYEVCRNNRVDHTEGYEAWLYDNCHEVTGGVSGVSYEEATKHVDDFIFNFIT